MSPRASLAHLYCLFATTYRVLGESAPSFDDDAACVRAYESARAMGEIALALRAPLRDDVASDSVPVLEEVLRQAVAADASGVLSLYCLSSLVGPRLLVSLRDAREFTQPTEEELAVLNGASTRLLGEMVAIGAVLRARGGDDEALAPLARDLAQRLEEAGYADSFGFSR